MKIIILGAGLVGSALAENLVSENNDITVVDKDAERLRQLQDRFDLRVIEGHASYPRILKEAGADDADMLVAVTNSDEVNMIACQIAYQLFNTPSRIARIHSPEYFNEISLFANDLIPIEHLISPEQLIIQAIYKLVKYPGALQVVNFAENRVSLVAVTAYYGGPLVGNAIAMLREHLPHVEANIVAIFRRGRPIRPQESTVIEAGDEVFFMSATEHILAVMSELQRLEKPYKRIMIFGGGDVGFGLAKKLEKHHSVKLIEKEEKRALEASELLNSTIVFYGDATDPSLLATEHIDQIDLVITATGDDEANIMSALLVKQLGAKKTISLIKKRAYIDLMQHSSIDITVSPQQATLSALLSYVHKADITSIATLRHGIAEAVEVVAHGDKNSSRVVGKVISQIKLSPGTTIGAVVRGDEVIIRDTDTIIRQGDHIIIFLNDKKYLSDAERIFQPSPFYL